MRSATSELHQSCGQCCRLLATQAGAHAAAVLVARPSASSIGHTRPSPLASIQPVLMDVPRRAMWDRKPPADLCRCKSQLHPRSRQTCRQYSFRPSKLVIAKLIHSSCLLQANWCNTVPLKARAGLMFTHVHMPTCNLSLEPQHGLLRQSEVLACRLAGRGRYGQVPSLSRVRCLRVCVSGLSCLRVCVSCLSYLRVCVSGLSCLRVCEAAERAEFCGAVAVGWRRWAVGRAHGASGGARW